MGYRHTYRLWYSVWDRNRVWDSDWLREWDWSINGYEFCDLHRDCMGHRNGFFDYPCVVYWDRFFNRHQFSMFYGHRLFQFQNMVRSI
jgi:hypothetical protein